MQRPVMDPTFLDEEERRKALAERRRTLRRIGALIGTVIRLLAGILLFDPLKDFRRNRLKIDDGPLHVRLFRGFVYRLAFVPVFVAMFVCIMVYAGTHPGVSTSEQTPGSLGLYYDPIRFVTSDGVNVDAWLVPALDATRVLADKEKAIFRKVPAVVLAHDFADRRQNMLPLIRPLHDAGFVVLVVALRGSDDLTGVGSTFGLTESQDLRAAVDLLRRRSFINPDHISLIGVGTGATGALLEAASDSQICAVVLDQPIKNIDQVLADHLGPRQSWLRWMRPLCQYAFELAYQVDTSGLDLTRYDKLIASRSILRSDHLLDNSPAVNSPEVHQTISFLKKHSGEPEVAGIGE